VCVSVYPSPLEEAGCDCGPPSKRFSCPVPAGACRGARKRGAGDHRQHPLHPLLRGLSVSPFSGWVRAARLWSLICLSCVLSNRAHPSSPHRWSTRGLCTRWNQGNRQRRSAPAPLAQFLERGSRCARLPGSDGRRRGMVPIQSGCLVVRHP